MLVDYTRIESVTDEDTEIYEKFDTEAHREPHTITYIPVGRDDTNPYRTLVSEFTTLLWDPGIRLESLYTAYRRIPTPGAAFVKTAVMHKFLSHLSRIEHKSELSMLRYMSVVEDMKSAHKALNVSEWTTAISFVGRCFKRISSTQVGNCLDVWKQMESEAGVKANRVTFNVLFDIATKAGKFVLADMILREMRARGLKMDRYFRTGLIYYYGLKGNGSGVRKAYRELVNAGQIVDTSVISCVIAALLLCREPAAAEHTLEKAKELHGRKSLAPRPPQDWMERKELGRSLAKYSEEYEKNPQAHANLQDSVPLAPGIHAYRALVYYHAVVSGDIQRVTRLVNEMQYYDIPLEGSIFLYLFRGFYNHGSFPYSPWTLGRLESTFTAFMRAVDAAASDEIFVGPATAEACLRAFVGCADRKRVGEIWEMLVLRWRPSDEERSGMEDLMASLWRKGEGSMQLPPMVGRDYAW